MTQNDAALAAPTDAPVRAAPLAGERLVVWTLWATYGAFYFGRTNLAVALPGIKDELGYSQTDMALVLGGLKLTYAIGQLVNGQLAERVCPRKLLAVGMLVSAALNLAFGLGAGLYFFLFVWAMNGYFQALGWTPCMRVAANWIPPARRGRAIGLIGTSYQVGAALTFILAGQAVKWLGWRGALYVPAAVLGATSGYMLLFLRVRPKPRPDASPGRDAEPARELDRRKAERGTWTENLVVTLTNPGIWLLAIALFFLNACRFGFLDWGVSYLKEVQGTGISKTAMTCAILPAGGIAGALATGWATDRFFRGRRAPAICVLLALLGLLTLLYDGVARTSFVGTVLLLVVIGFLIFGPQVLLVGTAPADLARRGTAAAAAGFVDFMGYVGAFVGDLVTGRVLDRSHADGWHNALFVWAACAFAASAAGAVLWFVTARTPAESR